MMLKEKSNPWAKLKYLYVLPLAAIAISAFAHPEISNELKEISEVKVNELTAIPAINESENQVAKLDTVGDWGFRKSEEIRARYQEEHPDKQQLNQNVNARIHIMEGDRAELTFDITNDGLEGMLGEATFCANSLIITGEKPDKPVNVNLTVLNERPLVILDGKESTLEAIQALDPNKILQINVMKDNESLQTYGDKGKFGVIHVEIKKDRDLEN